ncbi:SIS domain-containing protein [Xylariomycetidae sp. FL2044]|nr:SIS domain-containing protein [Xylariomycetidae sp. FL2044]
MFESHPVHNSEVYLLGLPCRSSVPPPSPPSPVTPITTINADTPIEPLCLDVDEPSAAEPSYEAAGSLTKQRLTGAIHVLNTQATALRSLTRLYQGTDTTAAAGFDAAVAAIIRHRNDRGRVVLIGIGKSGHIAKKLVATFNSLGLPATFLHPAEAIHGDLGKIGARDTILFITFSGKTPELLALLPHIDQSLATIVLTSHTRPGDCEIVRQRPSAVLLPAPIHEPEAVSFGVCAPTTSTTVALALGDALAVVAAQELHPHVPSVFNRNHPGGAIGAAAAVVASSSAASQRPKILGDLSVRLDDIPVWDGGDGSDGREPCGADILKLGYGSSHGWVRVGDGLVSPARIRALDSSCFMTGVSEIPGFIVDRNEWLSMSADMEISQAVDHIKALPDNGNGGGGPATAAVDSSSSSLRASIVAVLEKGEVMGVLEVGTLLDWRG